MSVGGVSDGRRKGEQMIDIIILGITRFLLKVEKIALKTCIPEDDPEYKKYSKIIRKHEKEINRKRGVN